MNFQFLVLLVFLTSSNGSPVGGDENIDDIIHRIQNFFTFLCTRCKEIVSVIDSAIDSQSLKKDANALCEAVLGFNEVTEKVCKSVVEDILGELYTQLKKLEPDHSACSHLHLCDACIVPGFNTEAPTYSFFFYCCEDINSFLD
uniref:Saposin B-type domain-containing protein n=1 Tax=Caenorhabditis tropicalis TaxID=1561998 RepID=A0A1I7UUK7_9PELO